MTGSLWSCTICDKGSTSHTDSILAATSCTSPNTQKQDLGFSTTLDLARNLRLSQECHHTSTSMKGSLAHIAPSDCHLARVPLEGRNCIGCLQFALSVSITIICVTPIDSLVYPAHPSGPKDVIGCFHTTESSFDKRPCKSMYVSWTCPSHPNCTC